MSEHIRAGENSTQNSWKYKRKHWRSTNPKSQKSKTTTTMQVTTGNARHIPHSEFRRSFWHIYIHRRFPSTWIAGGLGETYRTVVSYWLNQNLLLLVQLRECPDVWSPRQYIDCGKSTERQNECAWLTYRRTTWAGTVWQPLGSQCFPHEPSEPGWRLPPASQPTAPASSVAARSSWSPAPVGAPPRRCIGTPTTLAPVTSEPDTSLNGHTQDACSWHNIYCYIIYYTIS